jgi:hypothetical protein
VDEVIDSANEKIYTLQSVQGWPGIIAQRLTDSETSRFAQQKGKQKMAGSLKGGEPKKKATKKKAAKKKAAKK